MTLFRHDQPGAVAWPSQADAVWARRAVVRVFFASLVLSVAVVAGEGLATKLDGLEHAIASLGVLGPLLVTCTMAALLLLLVPESVLAVAAGAVLGMSRGLACTFVAGMLASSIAYLATRAMLRERVAGWVARRPLLVAIESFVSAADLRSVLVARLTPLQPAGFGYVQGLTECRYPAILASVWGVLPQEIVTVYIGYAARRLSLLDSVAGASAVPSPGWLVASVAAATLAMLYVSRIALHRVMDAEPAAT